MREDEDLTSQQTKAHTRVQIIDMLKGISILFVILTHYYWTNGQEIRALFPFWVDMAVPIFMLISGYVFANSYEKNKVDCLEKAYGFSFVLKKLIRYTVPYALIFIIEAVLMWRTGMIDSFLMLVIKFINGGKGPGSYYYPVMIQFVFVFPLIFLSIKRKPLLGILSAFFVNAVYEILQYSYGLGDSAYRILIFRYLFLIAFGCFVFFYNKGIKKRWLILLMALGIAYIVATRYLGFVPDILDHKWKTTNLLAALYIAPIFYILIKNFGALGNKFFGLLGKASFNIYLVQMLYYGFFASLVYQHISNRFIELVINFSVSILIGLLFYYIEQPFTNFILKKAEPVLYKAEKSIEAIQNVK